MNEAQKRKQCFSGDLGIVTATDVAESTQNATSDTRNAAVGDLITVANTSTDTNVDNISAKEDYTATSSSIPVPDAQVYKFNRYVDGIFDKINRILQRSYDPVNVRLSTSITLKQGNKKATTKKPNG